MELPLFEFARCLGMDPGIVARWIRQGRIPVKRKGDVCIFNGEILKKWAVANNVKFAMPEGEPTALIEEKPIGLYMAMKRGGVYYDLSGTIVSEVLRAAVNRMDGLETQALRDLLYEKLIDREQLMSTGIGRGVAVPHPRTPDQNKDFVPQIATFFLSDPVDFNAVDKQPIHTLFVLIASSAQHHLMLLSRLSFCLRDDSFLKMLKSRPEPDPLLKFVGEIESGLD